MISMLRVFLLKVDDSKYARIDGKYEQGKKRTKKKHYSLGPPL